MLHSFEIGLFSRKNDEMSIFSRSTEALRVRFCFVLSGEVAINYAVQPHLSNSVTS